jgi:hypothetical protein
MIEWQSGLLAILHARGLSLAAVVHLAGGGWGALAVPRSWRRENTGSGCISYSCTMRPVRLKYRSVQSISDIGVVGRLLNS